MLMLNNLSVGKADTRRTNVCVHGLNGVQRIVEHVHHRHGYGAIARAIQPIINGAVATEIDIGS